MQCQFRRISKSRKNQAIRHQFKQLPLSKMLREVRTWPSLSKRSRTRAIQWLHAVMIVNTCSIGVKYLKLSLLKSQVLQFRWTRYPSPGPSLTPTVRWCTTLMTTIPTMICSLECGLLKYPQCTTMLTFCFSQSWCQGCGQTRHLSLLASVISLQTHRAWTDNNLKKSIRL